MNEPLKVFPVMVYVNTVLASSASVNTSDPASARSITKLGAFGPLTDWFGISLPGITEGTVFDPTRTAQIIPYILA